MNSFSYSINIKQFQNLLDASVGKTGQQKIQGPFTGEKAKAELQAAEPKKD